MNNHNIFDDIVDIYLTSFSHVRPSSFSTSAQCILNYTIRLCDLCLPTSIVFALGTNILLLGETKSKTCLKHS
jgi:hypothetical protein